MDIDKMMYLLENWRINEVTSIAPSHQLIAFYLSVLTEEKFRCYALTRFLAQQSSFTGHIHFRDDVFTLEWALRCLNLPGSEFILIDVQNEEDIWLRSQKTTRLSLKILLTGVGFQI